jgi:hypothetical protein
MRSLLGTAVFLSLPGVYFLWQLAMIAILRPFGISLPFSFPFHFFPRRERELRTALNGKEVEQYVLVSGFLLFACPFLAALTTSDYLTDHYINQRPYRWNMFVVQAAGFLIVGSLVWLQPMEEIGGARQVGSALG